MAYWFYTIKNAVDQINEVMSNEETIGDTISEFAYTIQTGYPRYVLNNFSVNQLIEFLNHPHLDSFFVLVRKIPNKEELHYGILYKRETDEQWIISSTFDIEESTCSSMSLYKYLTGKEDISEHNFEITEEDISNLGEEPSLTDERILLLRPSTNTNYTLKVKRLINAHIKSNSTYESSSEYVFHSILNQPEYIDKDMFLIIRRLFLKILDPVNTNSIDIANTCKKIGTLFEDNYKIYSIGLMY